MRQHDRVKRYAFMMFLCVGFIIGTAEFTYAKTDVDWKTKYWNYLRTQDREFVENAAYYFISVNKDSVPELVVCDEGYVHMGTDSILTTDGKSVSEIGGRMAEYHLKYASRKNVIYYSSYLGTGCHGEYIYKIKNGKWRIVACGTDEDETYYWWSKGRLNELGDLYDGKGRRIDKTIPSISKESYREKMNNILEQYKLRDLPEKKYTYAELKKKLNK